MSWESTSTYYKAINDRVRERLGGLHSAKLLIFSFDFAEIEANQKDGDWDAAATKLVAASRRLAAADAKALAICTNTMHKVAERITTSVDLPLIHIGSSVGRRLSEDGVKQVALLGTQFTMEQNFYREKIRDYGIEVMCPAEAQRGEVHRIIYEELCVGRILDNSAQALYMIIDELAEQGCEAVILGCTELGMSISSSQSKLPVYDSTLIHAADIADFCMSTHR